MDLLTAGTDPGLADHYLWCTPETVTWGTLPTPATPPVLTIKSGDTVTFDTISQEGMMEDQGRDPAAYFARHGISRTDVLPDAIELAASGIRRDSVPPGPHIVLGPVHILDADPGDWLRVDFLEVTPRVPYGLISSRHNRGCLPERFPERQPTSNLAVLSKFSRVSNDGQYAIFEHQGGRAHIPIRPFMGLCGITPNHEAPLSTIPPGPHGGNMDIREITAGTSLYLPVQTPGAGFYLGDPHFAQGNGEIALTALEGSLRVTARLTVIHTTLDHPGRWPFVETDTHWIILGMHEDLNEAMQICANLSVDFVASHANMTQSEAYLYLSAAGDFAITQVVDIVKGVHCVISKANF